MSLKKLMIGTVLPIAAILALSGCASQNDFSKYEFPTSVSGSTVEFRREKLPKDNNCGSVQGYKNTLRESKSDGTVIKYVDQDNDLKVDAIFMYQPPLKKQTNFLDVDTAEAAKIPWRTTIYKLSNPEESQIMKLGQARFDSLLVRILEQKTQNGLEALTK